MPRPNQKIYNDFREQFPLEKVKNMSLEEYTKAGDDNTFTRWLESKLECWGSIWGGSSFKFGIYNRKDKKACSDNRSCMYTDEYAWYRKYGSEKNEVFEKIRQLIVEVIEAGQKGDLKAIDGIDLGDAYKWKIAFHYQNIDNPRIIPIFKLETMEFYFKSKGQEMHKYQNETFNSVMDAWNRSDEIWQKYIQNDQNIEQGIISESIAEDESYEEGELSDLKAKIKKRNATLVADVKKRDKYICKSCGFHYKDKIVQAHHLDPFSEKEGKRKVKKEDLITLCPNCHFLAHYLLIDDANKDESTLLKNLENINKKINSNRSKE